MFCSKCGFELPDDVAFCTKCGKSLQASPEHDVAAGIEDAGVKESAAPKLVIAIAMVVLVACAVVLILFLGNNPSSSAASGKSQGAVASASSSTAGAASPSAAADTDKVWTYKWFRVALPESVADRVTFTEYTSGECEMVDLEVDGIRVLTLETMRPKDPHGENEAKSDAYELGTASTGSESVGIRALVYYKSSRGDGIAHWGDSAATEFLCKTMLGLTPDELLDCIELGGRDGWVKAVHALMSSATSSTGGSTAGGGTSSNGQGASGNGSGSGASGGQGSTSATSSGDVESREAFWGIWIGASKDEGEALAFAAEASSRGLNASVTITADWENLNPEPWYVITAGRYSSEADASAKLDSVKAAGYEDAYVKYSGDHR